LKRREFITLLGGAAVALFCVGTASAFGWMLAYYQIPRALLANVTAWGMGITEVGFFSVFLVVGCFLDAIPAIIIVGTTLEPLARSVNMHPVQFAPSSGSFRSPSGW
jgi:TRAP-type C4-dicarboxylate transport system permease large subunit